MKCTRFVFVAVLLTAALAACAPRFDPDRSAQRFFDRGREQILDALESQQAKPAQLEQARVVLDRYGKTLPKDIAATLRAHKELLREITAGMDSSALLAQEDKYHASSVTSVQAIGRMHEELEAAVGKSLWQAATDSMRKRTARYFEG